MKENVWKTCKTNIHTLIFNNKKTQPKVWGSMCHMAFMLIFQTSQAYGTDKIKPILLYFKVYYFIKNNFNMKCSQKNEQEIVKNGLKGQRTCIIKKSIKEVVGELFQM